MRKIILQSSTKFLLLAFSVFLLGNPLLAKAQVSSDRILITKGSGTISGSNKQWIFIPFDLSNYQSGHYNTIVNLAGGDGISHTGGKCWARYIDFEDGKFDPNLSKPLPPNQGYNLGGNFDKPTKFFIGILPSCDPPLTNEYTYEVYLENWKPLSTKPPCGSTTSEKNPAAPEAGDALTSDARFNGKVFEVSAEGVNAYKDPIFYVNGINTSLKDATAAAKQLSRETNTPVSLVYNNSSLATAVEKGLSNPEILNNPPAAQALAGLMNEQRAKNKEALAIGSSQGAMIVAEAATRATKCSPPKNELCNIRVLTIGGAAMFDQFPQCSLKSGIAHKSDLVSRLMGESPALLPNTFSIEQHTNYFQDPATMNLLKQWLKGDDFLFKEIPDFPSSPATNHQQNGQIDDNNSQAYPNRGTTKEPLSDYQKAIEDYSQANRMDPNNSTALINRAEARIKSQEYQGALEDSTRAIELAPQSAKPYVTRATAKMKLQDFSGAIDDANQAIRLSPREPEAYVTRAGARANLQNYQGAIEDYSQALLINPKQSEAYTGRGIVKEKLRYSPCEDFQLSMNLGNNDGRINYQRACSSQTQNASPNPIPQASISSLPVKAETANGPTSTYGNVSGTWIGKYYCAQGITGLTLKLSQTGNDIQGQFAFYPLPENPTFPPGSAIYKGIYNNDTGEMSLWGAYWVNQPGPTWVMIPFSGNFDQNRLSFSGKIQFPTCGTIELRKQSDELQASLATQPPITPNSSLSLSSQPSSTVSLKEIELSFRSNLFDDTIRGARRFLESSPNSKEAHAYLGYSLLIKKDVENSIDHLQQAVQLGEPVTFPVKRLREPIIGQGLDPVNVILSTDAVIIQSGNTLFQANFSALSEYRIDYFNNQCPIVALKGTFAETSVSSSKTKQESKKFNLLPPSATLQPMRQGNLVYNMAVCSDEGVITNAIVKLLVRLMAHRG
jgi:FOG: TPR repeat